MNNTEHTPKTPAAGTASFASLRSLLHAQRSGARSLRRVFAAVFVSLSVTAAITAAPASAKEIYRQGENGESPSYATVGAPFGIAIDQATGDMYVAVGEGTIEKFNSAGAPKDFPYLEEMNNEKTNRLEVGGEFETVAVDNSTEPSDPNKGDFYIANHGKGLIEKFSETGKPLSSLPAPPEARGMAVDSNGDLYVASYNEEGKVFGFSSTGAALNSGNPVLVAPGSSPNPYGLAFNSKGDLYVSLNSEGGATVQEFEPEGSLFKSTPIEKVLPGESVDLGVAVNQKTNDVFVAAIGPNYGELLEFDEHGNPIETLPHSALWILYGVAVNETQQAVYATSTYFGEVAIFHAYHRGVIESATVGFGEVSASPKAEGSGAIEYCETTCEAEFTESSTVTLTANNIAHGELASWEGCTHESGDICEVEVGSGVTKVKATFRLIEHALAITQAGTGSGSVTCGPSPCSTSYIDGAFLDLTATPAPHSAFAGWSGACTNTAGRCIIEHLSSDAAVGATFNQLVPRVGSEGAGNIGQRTATVSAQLNPEGAPTSCKFEYGVTPAYGSEAPCSPAPGSGATNVQVTAELGGLTPGTPYFFRVSATNAGGGTHGQGESFVTASPETCATNVALCVKASNKFTIGAARRQGDTIALAVTVPGAGSVTANGDDIEPANDSTIAAGTVALKLKLTKPAKAAIKKARGHEVKVKVKVTYTPTGGTAGSATTTVVFKAAGGKR